MISIFLMTHVACKNIEPAPTDIDNLSHYLWQHLDDEEDDALVEGIINLHTAIGGDDLEEIQKGSVTALTQEELDLVEKSHQDASKLSGVYFANIINCSLDFAESSIYALNQDELHPGDYVRYDRQYVSDFEAYTNRETNILEWETNYEVEGLGYSYDAYLDSNMRYVMDVSNDETDLGSAFFSRGMLREPAYFDEDSTDRGMFQDFQMEIYWARKPKEVVHFYFIWREMVMFGDVDFSSETAQGFVLDGLADWDKDMEERCQAN